MALSKGDKVTNKYNIKGGLLGTDIPAGTKGGVAKIHLLGKVDVEFRIHGRNVLVRDIEPDDLKKAR